LNQLNRIAEIHYGNGIPWLLEKSEASTLTLRRKFPGIFCSISILIAALASDIDQHQLFVQEYYRESVVKLLIRDSSTRGWWVQQVNVRLTLHRAI